MTEQLTDLAKPFAPYLVKKPPKGKFGEYVPHHAVTQKILAVVGAHDFELVEVLRANGQVEGVICRMTLSIDGERHSVEEVGECEQPGNWNTDGARMKDAMSDAYKRCAMRFGIGLHLWAQSDYFLHAYLLKQGVDHGEPDALESASG